MAHAEMQELVRRLLTKYLNEKGHRKTSERYLILKTIYDQEGHFDVDAIHHLIKSQGIHISKATVYNTLELLLDAGLIRKHQFTNKAAYYEKNFFNKSHDHIILMNEDGELENIIEFCDPRIENIKKDLESYLQIDISGHDLYFYAKKKK
ncbi:MAG: transcriptional repressor [Chlorobi bacterium]|nr:transcriptional repressor [Chlorobiota bacterium]